MRKLAEKSSVTLTDPNGKPRTAEAMNTDRAAVYGRGEQNQVTAWLALRNNAAHARYDTYDHSQIALMLQGVRDFMLCHAA